MVRMRFRGPSFWSATFKKEADSIHGKPANHLNIEPSRMKREHQKEKLTPNKAMERSRVAVTDHADACSAPATRLAHLIR